ncbi:hypothetical protein DFH09DRAFT_398511 [Mycena vulgaris]|nr:hypothetical protein DFH09DRAFT_398511 [Mycena vulgaris]
MVVRRRHVLRLSSDSPRLLSIPSIHHRWIRNPATYNYPRYGYGTPTPSDCMIGLVKFCFDVEARSECQRLLLRFVPPPAGSTLQQHISNVLVPFLPVLRKYLAGQGLDLQTDPYKMFAAACSEGFRREDHEPKAPRSRPRCSSSRNRMPCLFGVRGTQIVLSQRRVDDFFSARNRASERIWSVSSRLPNPGVSCGRRSGTAVHMR